MVEAVSETIEKIRSGEFISPEDGADKFLFVLEGTLKDDFIALRILQQEVADSFAKLFSGMFSMNDTEKVEQTRKTTRRKEKADALSVIFWINLKEQFPELDKIKYPRTVGVRNGFRIVECESVL